MDKCRGERVLLRKMTQEAYHLARQRYVADPMVDREPYVYEAEQVDAQFDVLEATKDRLTACIFTLGGEIIGEVVFKRVDRVKGCCELGILLSGDAYKGKGFGGEAFALATAYAFEGLGMERVFADTMGSNVRMQRILERIGFHCYLCLQECYDMGGRWEDRLDYVLGKMEWMAQKQAKNEKSPG